MKFVEKSFPRGGIKNKLKNETKKKVIFGPYQKKKTHYKPKKERRINNDVLNLNKNIEAVSAELINFKTIQEEMLLVGVVTDIYESHLKISLPGKIIGKIPITLISESYSKTLKQAINCNSNETENEKVDYTPLKDLFQIGDKLYAKVVKIKTKKYGKLYIELSMKPKDVHSNIIHTDIKKGMILNGAIEEIQDHGYIIETGIKDFRCFLPLENITSESKTFCIGQLVGIKINKLTEDKSASTAICKEINNTNRKMKDLVDPKIDLLLPTTIIKFTVTKILKDGLQGTIMNGKFIAYCNEHQLSTPLSKASDYTLNSTYNAYILYVMPITKLVYVSLNLSEESNDEEMPYKRGDIIENAVVDHIGTGGVILNINDQYKGVISFKTIKFNLTSNFDEEELLSKYYKNSIHKVRILKYDRMDSLYICTNNPNDLNEQYFTINDVNIGDFVTGVIESKHATSKAIKYFVRVGKLLGSIENLYLSPTTKNLTENSKIRCRIVGINESKHFIYLTNRFELMKKNIKILSDYSQAEKNETFVGVVSKCFKTCVIVNFFNNIKGILFKNKDNLQNIGNSSLFKGQIMDFRIASCNNEKIILSTDEPEYKVGEIYIGEIAHKLENGFDVVLHKNDKNDKNDDNTEVNENDGKSELLRGMVPTKLLSEFPQLVTLKANNYEINDKIEMICLEKNIFSIRDIEYFKKNPIKKWNDIKVNDILRGFIKNIENDLVEIFVPIKGFKEKFKIHISMLIISVLENPKITINSEDICYVKVLNKIKYENIKCLTLSAKLTDVWSGDLKETSEYFANYFNELNVIKKNLILKNNLIGYLKLGKIYSGKVVHFNNETEDCYVQLFVKKNNENDTVNAVIKKSLLTKKDKLEIGKKLQCVVLWVDYLNDYAYVSVKSSELDRISEGNEIPENLKYKNGLNGKILLITHDVIICSLKKDKNPLIFIPTKLHYNDFENSPTCGIKEGDFCRISTIHETYSIGVFENLWKLWTKINEDNKRKLIDNESVKIEEPLTKKLKVEENYDKKDENETKEDLNNYDSDDFEEDPTFNGKNEVLRKSAKSLNKETNLNISKSLLPGPSDFWSNELENNNSTIKMEESSDDNDVNETEMKKKKKKLTAAERDELIRQEEKRLREIEEKYASADTQPETVDQFERLVISHPNDSKTWISYMVFHLQATEIDKARNIAKRALKTISFREEQDLINVWVALLNLELNYGTKETFDEVLKESLACNDQYKMYTRIIRILSEAKKVEELKNITGTCLKKFKDRQEMWRNVAISFYEVNLVEKVNQLLHKALAALPERDHINTIAIFANLSHKYGDKERAHTLFEQILTSYPKRVDIWSQYVDMLIKDNDLELARQTFERSLTHKISLKKMRTLFKKYLEFEEKFGTEENVLKVKEMAANYVKKKLNAEKE